ncbi:beta galactosidase jelly roll domain-containing protein [Sphingomonadaceae bacterium LXI357]|uniref:Beta galactosidase jelly roll domain-containing protein n=2 Tax=Stakelama marina TaxID=2826939 RepID=A0A8T4IE14_9SPHN|nr:beta galactosidase jelly roll domain-containing protein [Stakelama marina]
MLVAALMTVFSAQPGLAQESSPPRIAPVLAAADLRPARDLSGPWHMSIDPYRDGMAGFHGGKPAMSSRRYADIDIAETERRDGSALFEQDLGRSPVVTLPQSWLTQSAEMRHYQGLVWYQRHFDAHPQPGKRVFLHFGAANYAAHVYLNGEHVGEHRGGFTPFAFDVTDLLRDGDNQITVGVDSQRGDKDVPPPVTDWETYGGITRAVTLITVPETYVDDAWVRLTRDGRIVASGTLDGPAAANRAVRIAVGGLGLTMTARSDAQGNWSADAPAPAGLKRWSPQSPTLYDVRVTAGDDVWHDQVGFRTVSVDGDRILLNGKSVFLRGICIHEEEFGADPTRAITPEAARALLTEAKQGLHANYVRLAHYPHSPVMTRMADKLGLLVWSEIPVYWRVAFDDADTLKQARTMLAENILRDRDRASIILWSVGNETPVSDARTHFLTTLASDARRLDGTRLISAALLSHREKRDGVDTVVIDDPLIPALDVMAVNTYNGWYGDDSLASLPSIAWASKYRKPLIFSELGAAAKAGFHDPTATHKFSEEYQAEYYRQTLKMAEKVPFLRGMSPWILKDFRSPRRQHPIYQQGWNRKGLESETGRRKQAFDVLADQYLRWTDAPPGADR